MTETEQLQSSQREISDTNAALDEHAIVAITDPQGKITYVNDKFCAISGYSRAELLGQDHRIVNSGWHSREFMHNLWTTVSRGQVWRGEIKNKSKSGTFYWVATTIMPFLNEHGKPWQYVSIRTDISRQKQAEDDLQKLNCELEQRVADRTAELEAFSYSASHDLRSPLRTIDGYAQLILEDCGTILPEQARRQLGVIHSAAERMDALIRDLLALARTNRHAVSKERVDTAHLVNMVLAELTATDQTRAMEVRVDPLPACSADPLLLKQIWTNLLSNALKYTAKREQPLIEIGCTTVDGVDTFFVRDNGAGFDMRHAGHLFEAFARLHRHDEYDGTGVGLTIVRRSVSRHGGQVWAQAEVDLGATFYFTLTTGIPPLPPPRP